LALSPAKSFQRGEYAHLYLRRRDSGLAIVVTQTGIGGGGRCVAAGYAAGCRQPFTSFLALTGITTRSTYYDRQRRTGAVYHLAQSFSDATGFPLLSVIMIQVLGYSTPLLPYQASPIVVAMGLGKCLPGRGCCCVWRWRRQRIWCCCRWTICGLAAGTVKKPGLLTLPGYTKL
jgi:hypothetical protein